MARFRTDPKVELYVAGDWTDITSDVRVADGIEIEQGNTGVSNALPDPARFRCTLNSRDGRYLSWNPNGPYYGYLEGNTPIRCSLKLAGSDDFNRTVANTNWGTTPTGIDGTAGYAWDSYGGGGSVTTADWSVDGSSAIHSVPAASAYRVSRLTGFSQEKVEIQVDFQIQLSAITGGAVEPANITLRESGVMLDFLRVSVAPSGAITLEWHYFDASAVEQIPLGSTSTGLTWTTGQWLRVLVNAEKKRRRAKIWVVGTPEPLGWHINFDQPTTMPVGTIGVRTGVASGNTNTKPVVVKYDNLIVRSPRFSGEVAEWPPEIETSGNDLTVPIEAAGVLRRATQGQIPVKSALRRSIPTSTGLVAYWPLEDGENSTEFSSGLPGKPGMQLLTGTPDFAAFTDLAASDPLPKMAHADWQGTVLPHTFNGAAQVRFILNIPTGGSANQTILLRWYTDHPKAKFWQIVYQTSGSGSFQLQAWNSETENAFATSTLTAGIDGATWRVGIELTNSGSDVNWKVTAYNLNNFNGGLVWSGTATGLQVQAVSRAWVNVDKITDQVAIGHITVENAITTMFDFINETSAFEGEWAWQRIPRLASENGLSASAAYRHYTSEQQLGKQRSGTLEGIFTQTVDTAMGILSEATGAAELMYEDLRYLLYYRDPVITLDYAGRQIQPPLQPRRDDRDTRNKVTATRVSGGSATAEKTSGAKSTLLPGQGGVGVYDSSVTVNPETDAELPYIAQWRVALGTVDEPRYPTVRVERANPRVRADATLMRRLLDMQPGSRLQIVNAQEIYANDTIRQMASGYREYINKFTHSFEFENTPASPYDAFQVEDTTRGRLDSSSSTLYTAVSSSATTLQVVSTSEAWTQTSARFPMDIKVAGERMTVSSIALPTPTLVNAATAVHADNAAVAPGVPASTQDDDVLIVFAAVRNTAATLTFTGSSGWVRWANYANLGVWAKRRSGAESAPAVTPVGGSAGDTVSAVMLAFRNVPFLLAGVESVAASSAQDIAYPYFSHRYGRGLLLYFGQKGDDCTGVATLSGATEAVDATTTTGNDQSIVIDYQALTGAASVPAGVFTVTGGTTAATRGIVMLLGCRQDFTVTRAVNGVSKAQAAGAAVHVFDQTHWAK